MPCHHALALAEMLHAYVAAAGIADDRKGWLFHTSPRHSAAVLIEQPMSQPDICWPRRAINLRPRWRYRGNAWLRGRT
jgi:hypothetical protein